MKSLCVGDICVILENVPYLGRMKLPPEKSCMLLERIRSLKSGYYWKVLLQDGTTEVYMEEALERVVNH